MKKESDLRRGRHCVFRMHVHLVFVTKYRRNVFTKEVLDDLKIFFEKVCLDFESELVEFDGEDDHVHLLVNYPPKVAVSALVMLGFPASASQKVVDKILADNADMKIEDVIKKALKML